MKVVCVAANYPVDDPKVNLQRKQSDPPLFLKYQNSILDNNQDFYYDTNTFEDIVHELEIVVKITHTCKNLSVEEASKNWAEITVGIDLTDLSKLKKLKDLGHPWEIAKSFDHSAIIGAFKPKEEAFNDQGVMEFSMTCDGEVVQSDIHSNMIHSIDEQISFASKFFVLNEGDLIFTGTPKGVGSIKIGQCYKGYLNHTALFTCNIKDYKDYKKPKSFDKALDVSVLVKGIDVRKHSDLDNTLFYQIARRWNAEKKADPEALGKAQDRIKATLKRRRIRQGYHEQELFEVKAKIQEDHDKAAEIEAIKLKIILQKKEEKKKQQELQKEKFALLKKQKQQQKAKVQPTPNPDPVEGAEVDNGFIDQHEKVNMPTTKSVAYIIKDLKELINTKKCGPILIRLSWHDAGVYTNIVQPNFQVLGGCPNAALRFTECGEGAMPVHAGLADVAIKLLEPITQKYVIDFECITRADLWALAANVSIECMGGPKILTRFGRWDATTSMYGCDEDEMPHRLPKSTGDAEHLRYIFYPKGFKDIDIVALSGMHTVGSCHEERSGYQGSWTKNDRVFNNEYFKNLVNNRYTEITTKQGKPQMVNKETNTIMLKTDIALVEDKEFYKYVKLFSEDQQAFFDQLSKTWTILQEFNIQNLRNIYTYKPYEEPWSISDPWYEGPEPKTEFKEYVKDPEGTKEKNLAYWKENMYPWDEIDSDVPGPGDYKYEAISEEQIDGFTESEVQEDSEGNIMDVKAEDELDDDSKDGYCVVGEGNFEENQEVTEEGKQSQKQIDRLLKQQAKYKSPGMEDEDRPYYRGVPKLEEADDEEDEVKADDIRHNTKEGVYKPYPMACPFQNNKKQKLIPQPTPEPLIPNIPTKEKLEQIISDLKELVEAKKCGAILIKLSWHDAGVYSTGKLEGGSPNAVMRFSEFGESTFDVNKGLQEAVQLLKNTSNKYCPDDLSHADLYALAANVAIESMGGPSITPIMKFGRIDAVNAEESVATAKGRLILGEEDSKRLKLIYHPKGFTDRDIVALTGAHTVGRCDLEQLGFEGQWTENNQVFDNKFFKNLCELEYETIVTTSKGKKQYFDEKTKTIMLQSDMALIDEDNEEDFFDNVMEFYNDQQKWFDAFTLAWVKLQELGCGNLKNVGEKITKQEMEYYLEQQNDELKEEIYGDGDM